MWREAAEAGPGLEADTGCSSVKEGVCIPMFKNKGDRACKDNCRNLVMLSVAAKLIARIVASRLSAWIDVCLSEQQNGFRSSRGIDDAHQLVRRILEEVVVAEGDSRVCVTSFDIVRAYTRVCRDALWCLLSRLGAPPAFVQVLKALHEHTRFRVFVHNGYSSDCAHYFEFPTRGKTSRGAPASMGAERPKLGHSAHCKEACLEPSFGFGPKVSLVTEQGAQVHIRTLPIPPWLADLGQTTKRSLLPRCSSWPQSLRESMNVLSADEASST